MVNHTGASDSQRTWVENTAASHHPTCEVSLVVSSVDLEVLQT